MPRKQSAGTLLYRRGSDGWEVFGVMPGELVSLGFIEYKKSRKDVHCFAGPAPADAEPRPTSWEVDQARFVTLDEARRILHPNQVPFLDRLLTHLAENAAENSPRRGE